jgi:hypothetical protein
MLDDCTLSDSGKSLGCPPFAIFAIDNGQSNS